MQPHETIQLVLQDHHHVDAAQKFAQHDLLIHVAAAAELAHERAVAVYQQAAQAPGLQVVGIDCHIGSQITEVTPYLDAMDRMLDLVEAIEAAGVPIAHLDFGGGLGIDYQGDQPPAADALWAQLLAKLDARGHGHRMLMVEPGRSLVGNAGVCLTEVLYTKPGSSKNF